MGSIFGSLLSEVIISAYKAGGQFIAHQGLVLCLRADSCCRIGALREAPVGRKASVNSNLADYVDIMSTISRWLVTLMALATPWPRYSAPRT